MKPVSTPDQSAQCPEIPSDYTFFTPGHLLVDISLTALPKPDVSQSKVSDLDSQQDGMQDKLFFNNFESDEAENISLTYRRKWFKCQENLSVNE